MFLATIQKIFLLRNIFFNKAGTYVKLQQAYISEAVAIGNWSVIGYKGPGDNTAAGSSAGASSSTNNFNYKDATGYNDNTITLATGATGFTAGNKAKLNDCDVGDHWTISIAAGDAAGEATFTPGDLDADCLQLTPNFSQIGK